MVEHAQWSTPHVRTGAQQVPGLRTSTPTRSWASAQHLQHGCSRTQALDWQHWPGNAIEVAAKAQAPALQVWDQSLCLLRTNVRSDEATHFISSHGHQGCSGHNVVVSCSKNLLHPNSAANFAQTYKGCCRAGGQQKRHSALRH